MSHDDHCCPPSAAEIRLQNAAMEGCEESKLLMTRRAMLGVTAGLFSWAYMPRFAEGATNDPRLLVVVLRGGMDGINVCIPHGDRNYTSMRGDIAIPRASAIKINANSDFTLHPALRKFGAMLNQKDAAVVHAACVPLRNRSHFDCQDNLENGLPGANVPDATGWLNRLLAALPAGAPVKTRGAIQVGEAPLILRGPAPVLGWSPTWFSKVEDPLLYMIRTLYREKDPEMYSMLESGLKADRIASRVDKDDGDISSLRKAFRGAARLIAANDGPRIAVLSVGGWDTHSDQGAAQGQLAGVLSELDAGLADFKIAVGRAWDNTVVVCATEFGRTVRVNGDSGTDHGVGTTVLLAGGAVNGGKVFGDWPGLAPNQLYEDSDLRPTTDIRSVFKGILRDHLGVGDTMLNQTIFPSSAVAAPMNRLIKTSPGGSLAQAPSAPTHADTPIARYRRGQKVSQRQAVGGA